MRWLRVQTLPRIARPLRPSRLTALTAVCMAAAVVLLSVLGGSGTPAPAPHARHGDNRLQSIFGGAVELMNAPASTLDTLRQLGVDRIRVGVTWSQIAPDPTSRHAPAGFDASDPASYPAANWAPFDHAFADAAARGIGVEATIGGPAPLWAEQPGDPLQKREPLGVWKPKAAAFGAFVRAVAKRYDGHYTPPGARRPLPRISFWSIWNEPNNGQDLAPQAIDHSRAEVAPALYRGLLDAGYAALHATGHGGDTILFGELAPRGNTVGNVPGNFGGMVPLRFIRALYCVNGSFQPLRGRAASERQCPPSATGSARFASTHPALFDATGLAAHLYPQGQPPTQRAADEPDYADFASLPELEQTLDRAQQAYGSKRQLPIYSTEFGYHTNPPEQYMPSPTVAANYLNEAEYLSWLNLRVKSYGQYLLEDPHGTSYFDTGLETSTGTPKLTFDAYRLPLYLPQTTQPAGGSLEVWGCIRPAHFYTTKTAELQFARSGSGSFKTLQKVTPTNSAGYFDTTVRFRGSGTVRLAWRYPAGQQAYSRTVQVTVR